jgi:hypothetical protein
MSAVVLTSAPYPTQPPYQPQTNPYVTVGQFRTDFPAFGDTVKFPDAQIQRFLDVSGCMINACRWGCLSTMGMELITAHFLTMQSYFLYRSQGMPFPAGMAMGIPTSKSVSKVSVGSDIASFMMEGWGPWNYTIYGQQYAYWAMLVGTGGYEVLMDTTPGVDLSGTVNTWARGVFLAWGS